MLFEKLNTKITNLDEYIENNFVEILKYFQQDYNTHLKDREEIEKFISLNRNNFKKLKSSKSEDFLLLLLEISEKLDLSSNFISIYGLLKEFNINIPFRLQSVYLFYNNNNPDEYVDSFDEIINLLHLSYIEDEYNVETIISTIINYYALALSYWGEYNLKAIVKIRNKILSYIKSNKYAFLNSNSLKHSLELDYTNYRTTINQLKKIAYNLVYQNFINQIKEYDKSEFIIEENTSYSVDLQKLNKDFKTIRQLNTNIFKTFNNKDEIFSQLRRGIHILNSEEQLVAYINSYGLMHYYKLIDTFKFIPLNNKIEIVDWGCGQGLATISLLEYILKTKKEYNIEHITLIEPSYLAIKRASLHIKHFKKDLKITTINSDISTLINDKKIVNYTDNIKIHLFSNILDIEAFSLEELAKYILSNFKGTNYFIITSPFLPNASKRLRISLFENFFKKENLQYKSHLSIENKKGEWIGKKWSRIIKVFSITNK